MLLLILRLFILSASAYGNVNRDRFYRSSSGWNHRFYRLNFYRFFVNFLSKKRKIENGCAKIAKFWTPIRELLSPRRSRGSKFFAILVLKNLLIVRSFGWVFRILAIFCVFFEGELREESTQKYATTGCSDANRFFPVPNPPVCELLPIFS